MWLKPSQKKEIEKEKLLSSFCEGASRKKIEYILKCKCYSYLEFILNVLLLSKLRIGRFR